MLALPRVELHASVSSTLDVANAIAADAPSGTLILADEQTSGRGRHGRRWASPPGAGLWLTIIERPTDARALEVLALRCGLFAAEALDALASGPIGVKWPNDLYVGGRKLAGVLIETRWRGTSPEWVAIGFGLNVAAPGVDGAIGLAAGTTRLGALARLAPALRRAAAASRHLSSDELARWQGRDVAVNQRLLTPAEGSAGGITSAGELIVRRDDGTTSLHRTGSLTFANPLACS
ncbi:MAG: biotin/acetyl-CoA-carboxylase ligase [Gemmatimonadetes bacterium]|nr:biotin/acetyl-CoA-carboxylase ligase [Gemmatimonadota bacterium]